MKIDHRGRKMRFKENQNASIAVIFALTSIPALAMVGAAMDYSSSGRIQTGLRDTLDAAAIAGAIANAKPGREDETRSFVHANVASRLKGVTLGLVKVSFNDVAATVTVTADATVKTTFSQLFGVTSVTVKQSSTATWSSGSNRVSFVLDATGSLRRARVDADMRTAALNFVDLISAGNANPKNLHVAVVPFASMVNVGADKTNWLSSKYSATDYLPSSWSGCVYERDDRDDISISTPRRGEFDPHIWPKTYTAAFGFNDWAKIPLSDFSNGISGAFPDDGGTEIISGPNVGCMAPILPLTSDMTAVKARINDLVMLSATGGTILTSGLVWGWRSLSPDWAQFWRNGGTILPQDKQTGGTIILITDGENDWYHDDIHGRYGLGITAYGRPEERRHGFGPGRSATEAAADVLGTTTSDPTLAAKIASDFKSAKKVQSQLYGEQLQARTDAINFWNTRFSRLCKNIKASGIEIYTIAFGAIGANARAEEILRECASSKDNYFASPSRSSLEKSLTRIKTGIEGKTTARIIK
jgi:Flp pilus assembly protein TadG